MKKLYSIILALVIIMVVNSTATHAKTLVTDTTNGNTIKVTYSHGKTKVIYNGKTKRVYSGKFRAVVVDERDFTYSMKVHRANKRVIYIEKVVGKCVRNNYWRDGESYRGYIAYRRVRNVHKGDKITTYFVWCPTNNSPDDIDERFDVVTSHGGRR